MKRFFISRRDFLAHSARAAAATPLLLSACRGQNLPADSGPPNIAILILDTLRADALGCYGAKHNTSPELDALAARGALAERAYADSNWTAPSVASLLTSRYPREVQMVYYNSCLAPGFTRLPQVLQAAGYRTYGITANPVINSWVGVGLGFDKYIDGPVDAKGRMRPATEIYAEALAMAREKEGAPGFLMTNIVEPHEYYHEDKQLTREEFRGLFSEVPNEANRRDYLQAVRQASQDTIVFIDQLCTLPGWENTLVVLLADHGEGLNDHPGVWNSTLHRELVYSSVAHVPLMFFDTRGRIRPQRITRPIQLSDVAPTLLDFAGVGVPGEFRGQSLLPLLTGGKIEVAPREFLLCETYGDYDKSAVVSAEWQYIVNRDLHGGCALRELQPLVGPVNGKHTDQLDKNRELARAMADYLARWQDGIPLGTPLVCGASSELDQREEDMRSIGYL